MNVADLVPRTDIADRITDSILAELSDSQWKVRAKALQDIAAILNGAKFITPNVGELPTALNTRLKKDSNKILVCIWPKKRAVFTLCTILRYFEIYGV